MSSAIEYFDCANQIYKSQKRLLEEMGIGFNYCLLDDMSFLKNVLHADLIEIKIDKHIFGVGSLATKKLRTALVIGIIGSIPFEFRRSIDEESVDSYDSFQELCIGDHSNKIDMYNDIIDEWEYDDIDKDIEWTDRFYRLTEEMVNNPALLLAYPNSGIRNFAQILIEERAKLI